MIVVMAEDEKHRRTSQRSSLAPLVGFDPKLAGSVAESLKGIASLGKVDSGALREVASSFQVFKPVVAAQLAQALATVPIMSAPSFKAVTGEIPALDFTHALAELDLSRLTGTAFLRSFEPLHLPAVNAAGVGGATALPVTVEPELATEFDQTAHDAIALAEVDALAQEVDAFGVDFEAMTPRERRQLALDVAVLIGAARRRSGPRRRRCGTRRSRVQGSTLGGSSARSSS